MLRVPEFCKDPPPNTPCGVSCGRFCLAMSIPRPIPIRMPNVVPIGPTVYMERGSSAVECRTRNQVSPGSNPPFLPFRRLGIFVLYIDPPVDIAV